MSEDESSVLSRLSKEEKVRIVMKRFVFSRKGQVMYLCVIGTMCLLSVVLVLFSLISQTVRRSRHHIYRRIFWIQALEALVDFTFLMEVLGRLFILGNAFWQSALSYIDLAIAVGCVGTFFLYNFYPDHEDAQSENAESIIYISRQTIRFVRCVYFFMWFSDSLVQFNNNEKEKSSQQFSLDMHNPSRMASPFITPLPSPKVRVYQTMSDLDNDFSLGESASQLVRDVDSELEEGSDDERSTNDLRERRIVENLALLIDSPLSWDTGDDYYGSQDDERTPLVVDDDGSNSGNGINSKKKKLQRRYESF